MIKVESIETWGFEHAIRGMRNPLNSWHKMDSEFEFNHVEIGDNDMGLMKRLYNGGSEHRKYLRQIFISMDITAPLYWWKEMDKYQVGTTTNSCSTMHKIHAKEFTLDDFSHEHLSHIDIGGGVCAPHQMLKNTIQMLNECRALYLQTKDKEYWWQMIQLLPSSYNQKRTITMNYENAVTMIKQRSGHKLDEWNQFVAILKDLPYMREIMGE